MPKKKTEVDVKSLQKHQQNLLNSKPGVKNCEKVLGSRLKVGEFASTWQSLASDFQLVGAVKLLEFAQTGEFTPEEFEAFKYGLSVIPAFLDECFTEFNTKPKEII